jgi:hypothetical protein
MKKSGLLLLLPLILISLMSFVVAQTTLGDIFVVDSFAQQLFYGLFGVDFNFTWTQAAIVLIIFLMLAFAFSDIFNNLTMFSTWVCYLLGFGLALIAALTRLVLTLAIYTAQITAAFGVVSVFVSLIIAFVFWVLIHLGVENLGKWIIRRQAYMKASKSATEVTTSAKFFKEFGQEFGLTK